MTTPSVRIGPAWLAVLNAGILTLGVLLSLSADGADAEPQQFYVEDIKSATEAHVAKKLDTDGIFHLKDDVTGEMLALRFVKVHDPVRQIDGDTYFACTDFSVVGEPEKLYDIDFWLRPAGNVLEVYETKVHKEPRKSFIYGWYKYPRYTFIDDKVVPLY